jgi:hypothetical protein
MKIIISLIGNKGWKVNHMDIKTNFMNDEFTKDVFAQQLEKSFNQAMRTMYANYMWLYMV